MASGVYTEMSARLKAGLAIMAILALISYGVLPIMDWQKDLVARITDLQKTIARKKSLVGLEDQINAIYQESLALHETWRQYFEIQPSDPQALQLKLQKQVEELARKHDISITNVDWIPPVGGEIIRAPVKFRMESTPKQLMQLLFDLERSRPFIEVEGIRIIARGQSAAFTVEIDIISYGISEELIR